jgi:hypothetical protein
LTAGDIVNASDETAITEIMIHPDGRIFVFGLSREVGEILESLCPPDHPLMRSLEQAEAHTIQTVHEPAPHTAE